MTAVIVIGGGFTGAALAIALCRRAPVPLDIAVIEPRVEFGRGVAFSATDHDHRINAPATSHFVVGDDAEGFDRWLRQTGRVERDPEMTVADGSLFPRRTELGTYVHLTFEQHAARSPSGSLLRHIHSRATTLAWKGEQFHVSLENGETLIGDLAIITTSNEKPRPQAPFAMPLTTTIPILVSSGDPVAGGLVTKPGQTRWKCHWSEC
ncbi:putative NAD(P)/FAD-binding protein YdhS [Bradyrhizobium sp. CIR18]|uniref:FAD/NAD(P)-binding protein n=1 Tax=Bradyrhizobium sp. CIR18 TaxID=2663839 RepID=UPI00160579C7|nr:FAD/NAD(P)-binding protein [Bradyrhizobium sp. CIR18]MBB4366734.1 putative NAD(P)/FAD-binding protein YdhS [Bradyrhizobium sp. CIR18]